MKIEIDGDVIAKTLNDSATKAVADACTSYKVREKIEENIAETLVAGILIKAIDEAVVQIDFAGIGKEVGEELTKSIVKVVITTIREACVQSTVNLKGLSRYSDSDKPLIDKIEEEFAK